MDEDADVADKLESLRGCPEEAVMLEVACTVSPLWIGSQHDCDEVTCFGVSEDVEIRVV